MTTWTPKTQQAEAWTEQAQPVRVFDPYVFDRAPIFDTGPTGGVWDVAGEQSEVWTQA